MDPTLNYFVTKMYMYVFCYYPAGKAVFRHCGIELEGVPLVSVPLCDETCMHAPMHRCTVLPFGVANGPSYFQEFMLDLFGGWQFA